MDNKKRTVIQALALMIQNANFKGFFTGKIYQGKTKQVCVPGLNCYSCPGAVGSCPIGSLQNSLSGIRFRVPYYVVGLLLFFGVLLGRMICGFLCPFGFIQDLLYKIPFFKKIKTFKGDKRLRYLKYAVLVILVVILPVLIKLTPFFCKYLCPSGTLSGLLLAIADHSLVKQFGKIFTWKVCVLVIIIVFSLMICRPFCKYLCPLGAIYAPMNKFSVVQMSCDKEKCNNCKACLNCCDMYVDPSENSNSLECIRCGKCIKACPQQALHMKNIFTKS